MTRSSWVPHSTPWRRSCADPSRQLTSLAYRHRHVRGEHAPRQPGHELEHHPQHRLHPHRTASHRLRIPNVDPLSANPHRDGRNNRPPSSSRNLLSVPPEPRPAATPATRRPVGFPHFPNRRAYLTANQSGKSCGTAAQGRVMLNRVPPVRGLVHRSRLPPGSRAAHSFGNSRCRSAGLADCSTPRSAL